MAAESSRDCTANGVVTAATAGRVEVEIEPRPACLGCNGTCRWYGEGGPRRLAVPTRRTFAVGAPVTLGVAHGALLYGAVVAYGLPLLGLLGGALLGFVVSSSDLGTAAGGGAGLAAALAVAWCLRVRIERGALHALTILPANGGADA